MAVLCVSIAPQSQRFAVFDMFNASGSCDLIELRLDRLEKAPDFQQLLEQRFKPLVVSCRRKQDGGEWDGTEEARLALLRQAILAKPEYIEIEVDVADQIRRYGPTKRVVAYTNTLEVPEDLADIYRECQSKDPDVVKITVPARTPEEAWPVVKLVAKSSTPTVVVGWGRSGRMLSVLGQRYKAPWTYAALERGMEAYPGMATIRELKDVYDIASINHKTPLLGVSGRLEEQTPLIMILNHGFRMLGKKTRCLPLGVGEPKWFQKVVDAIKLEGVVVDDRHRRLVVELLENAEEQVQLAEACDFVSTKDEHWKGFSALPRAVASAIEEVMMTRRPEEPPMEGKSFLVIGASGTARAVAVALNRKKASVLFADQHNDRAQLMAKEIGGRYVPNGQAYSILVDGLVLTADDTSDEPNVPAFDLPASSTREGLVVVDLSASPFSTPLLEETRVRRGIPILPIDILARTARTILRGYSEQELDLTELKAGTKDWEQNYETTVVDWRSSP